MITYIMVLSCLMLVKNAKNRKKCIQYFQSKKIAKNMIRMTLLGANYVV